MNKIGMEYMCKEFDTVTIMSRKENMILMFDFL